MATFNSKSFEKKLRCLESTQTAIQTLSLWILHHRHHAEQITNIWLEQLIKANKSEKKLGLFYLVNDVVQNGRRKAKSLVTAFGGVLLEGLHLLRDPKIKSQVERVFNIWLERSVYDMELINAFKQKIDPPAKPKKTPVVSTVSKEKAVVPAKRKTVPLNFKVANLLVSMKKATNYDNEIDRKSVALEKLKIDASSFESVKHVKDRSSVGRFHKQFEESKILIDDYIQTLKRCQRDKLVLMALLNGGEIFYEVAQDEAKVIVNAYKTFGNRLNSMKKKLDSKIRRIEEQHPAESSQSDDNCLDDVSDGKNVSSSSTVSPIENSSIQDMDLDSDSDNEQPDASNLYNPLSAPDHDQSDPTLSQEAAANMSSVDSQEDFYSKYEVTEDEEELDEQYSFETTPMSEQDEQQKTHSFQENPGKEPVSMILQDSSESLQKTFVSSSNSHQQDALAMIGLAKQIQSDMSHHPNAASIDENIKIQEEQLSPQIVPSLNISGQSLTQQQLEGHQQTLKMIDMLQRSASQQQQQQQQEEVGSPQTQNITEIGMESQSYFNSSDDINSFFDLPPLQLNMGKESFGLPDNTASTGGTDLHSMNMMAKILSDSTAATPDGLVIAEETLNRTSEGNTVSYDITKVSSSSVATPQLQNFQVISSNVISSSVNVSQNQVDMVVASSYIVPSNMPTPVRDEKEKLVNEKTNPVHEIPKSQQPLQSLIDSLFPVLSKSLQTIKEKQQAADEGLKPSISEAMSFALGSSSSAEEVPRKKNRFGADVTPAPVVSPLSLTNPKGLSENQTELISIAAGLTKFDENFLPVSKEGDVTPPLEELGPTQQSVETSENEVCDYNNDEVKKGKEKDKETDDYEKKREERKSRHSSSRHRSSHKDDDRRKPSSSPSRRASHRDDDRHKRSSSRSPSRRSSHRSSRDSRDDRHSDRRKSSRRSQSPRRRRSNRGRRSLSRDWEDTKRRRSPDSNRAPYYNDRRSPTPEMDSSSHPPQFTQNIIAAPLVNQMLQNQPFQLPSSSITGISSQPTLTFREPNQESSNSSSFLNTGVLMNPSIYHASEDPGLSVTESNMLQSNNSTKNDDSLTSGKPGDTTTIMHMTNQLRPATVQIDQSSIGGSLVPPILNFDSSGRPMLVPGIQLRSTNPMQLLQQRTDPQQSNILHLRPLPPGLISINGAQSIMGSMGASLVIQNDISQKPVEQCESESEPSTSHKGENSIQKASDSNDGGVTRDDIQAPSNFDTQVMQDISSLPEQSVSERPPFSFPPPPFFQKDVRPSGDGNKIFAPRIISDPLNTRFNEPSAMHFERTGDAHFGAPRPVFNEPRGPCFEGPRGPRFDGPMGLRFDGPRCGRFDPTSAFRSDAPRGGRFTVPLGGRFDTNRVGRFDGPRHFHEPRGIRFEDNKELRSGGPDASFDQRPRDGHFERPDDTVFDELDNRQPKCAEPDPLLDQLEAQQNQIQSQQETQHRQPPPVHEEHPPSIEEHGDRTRPKFKPAFSEVRPFNEPRQFHDPRPRFRPVFNAPPRFRFRPRFERRPFRPLRPGL